KSIPINAPYNELFNGDEVMAQPLVLHPMKYQYANPIADPRKSPITHFRYFMLCYTFLDSKQHLFTYNKDAHHQHEPTERRLQFFIRYGSRQECAADNTQCGKSGKQQHKGERSEERRVGKECRDRGTRSW